MKTKLLLFTLFISLTVFSQNEKYQKIEQSLDQMSQLTPGSFTVFAGMDLNFAQTRFSGYLQDSYMNLSDDIDGFVWADNKITQRFVPRASDGSEYLKVTYYVKDTTGVPTKYPTSDGISQIITKVDIEGSANLVAKLFINYWPYALKLGGYEKGEIAHYQALGDYVSLSGLTTQIYKLTISKKGNLHVDYYSMYKIR